jgi:hypothetical protein
MSSPGEPLKGYRWLWWATLLLITVPALLLAAIQDPVVPLVAGVTAVGIRVGRAALGADVLRKGLVDAAAAVALIVAAAPTLGRATVPLLLLAAARAVQVPWAAPWSGPDDRPIDSAGGTADAGACLAVMTGEELCELWSRSFDMVRSGAGTSRHLVGAHARDSVLTELQRRDSGLLEAWLARSPSPASRPVWARSTRNGHRA